MATIELVREFLGNDKLTLNGINQVRMEETSQTLGQVFENEEEVTDHLRILAQDQGNEWEGVDSPMLYHQPRELAEGLSYLGEDVWYQRY